MKQDEFVANQGKRPSTILEEIKKFSPSQLEEERLDSRANHIIQSAINMIDKLTESYDEETSQMLKRRFLNSIKTKDPEKFSRAIRRAKKL